MKNISMSYLKENLDIKKVVKNLDKQIFDNDDNILNAVMDSYKDLIDDGYEVKSYSISDIKTANGLMLILFVTVLQKDKDLYECQEYQTMDQSLETLDMSLICKQLVQPYQRGVGT